MSTRIWGDHLIELAEIAKAIKVADAGKMSDLKIGDVEVLMDGEPSGYSFTWDDDMLYLKVI